MGIKYTRKGIYYFDSYEAARNYAVKRWLPTERIICYEIGWAIQVRKSGPYIGQPYWENTPH